MGLEHANRALAVSQDNLGVRADVDEELDCFGPMGPFVQDRGRRVSANVASDAWGHIEHRIRQVEFDVSGGSTERTLDREWERCLAQGSGVEAEHQVVHDWIAHDGDIDDVRSVNGGELTQLGGDLIQRSANSLCQLDFAAWVHHHVADPAHQILAEPNLRIHLASGGKHLAGCEVDEMASDGR